MKPLLKILTVTLSLIACAACGASTVGSARHVGIATSVRVVLSAPATDPGYGAEAVTNFYAGIARQERADAEALAKERAGAVQTSTVRVDAAVSAPAIGEPAPAAPPAPYVGGIHAQPFLICVRRHESDRSDVNGNGLYDGGYAAKNPSSSAAGAYQFLLSTWNSVVNAMGHPEWAGDPRDFSDDVQDQVAWWTYQNQGAGPWSGSGCS